MRDKASGRSQGSKVPFGYQLVLDCFGCDEEICCDLERGYEFLNRICVLLEVAKQTQPYTFKTNEHSYPDKPGYSGWVPIHESGIQIHTSATHRFISIDIYSCKQFNEESVIEFVKQWFEPQQIDTCFLHRGQDILQRRFPGVADKAAAAY